MAPLSPVPGSDPGPRRRSRRDFLRQSAALTVGAAVAGAGSFACASLEPAAAPIRVLPPAAGFDVLTTEARATLLATAEILLPEVPAKEREGAVTGFDRTLAQAPKSMRPRAAELLASLDGRLTSLGRAARAAAFEDLARSEDPQRRAAYALVKNGLVHAAYAVPEAWRRIGYRGSRPGAA